MVALELVTYVPSGREIPMGLCHQQTGIEYFSPAYVPHHLQSRKHPIPGPGGGEGVSYVSVIAQSLSALQSTQGSGMPTGRAGVELQLRSGRGSPGPAAGLAAQLSRKCDVVSREASPKGMVMWQAGEKPIWATSVISGEIRESESQAAVPVCWVALGRLS